jgi:hypothetical protein
MKLISASILLLLFSLSIKPLDAQEWSNTNAGLQVVLSADLGSHVHRFGIRLQGYYTYGFAQVNLGNQFAFNSKNLASRINYRSNRISAGLVILAGKTNAIPNFIFDGLAHQTQHQYGFGYNYIWYLDNANSAQRSAGIGIHIDQFSLLVENDLFSFTGRDRFRTSHFSGHYRTETFILSVNSQLWTGETWGTELQNTPDSMYSVGYKDLSKTLYGRSSHGILSLGIDYLVGYGNRTHAMLGIDHERIRNLFQNRLIHEKEFLPKRIGKRYVSYPMLDEEGLPIHKKGEEKPGEIYFQLGINRNLTY